MSFVAAIQMNSTADVAINLTKAQELLAEAAAAGAQLAVLPENFALMGRSDQDKLVVSEPFGHGPIQAFLQQQARQHQLWLVGGTIPLANKTDNRVRAANLVFNPEGVCVARYDKIHLFDVQVIPGQEEYRESATIAPGEAVQVVNTDIGKLGLAVCYDVRFPELFRLLAVAGSEIFALPAAFTVPTGRAHWDVLVRARAIENQCFMIAAAQTGKHPNGRLTYGHSMIVDPWGKVLAELPEGEGIVVAEVDLDYLASVRAKMPIAHHIRLR